MGECPYYETASWKKTLQWPNEWRSAIRTMPRDFENRFPGIMTSALANLVKKSRPACSQSCPDVLYSLQAWRFCSKKKMSIDAITEYFGIYVRERTYI